MTYDQKLAFRITDNRVQWYEKYQLHLAISNTRWCEYLENVPMKPIPRSHIDLGWAARTVLNLINLAVVAYGVVYAIEIYHRATR